MTSIPIIEAMHLEHLLLLAGVLLLVSIVASKASEKFGIPALLLFLVIGMLAGSDGILGIYFDDAEAAQNLGVIALAFILFGGGLDTSWSFVRKTLGPAMSLATFGVVLTTCAVGVFVYYFLGWTLLESLLLGAIISSTDAAAVFSVLRSRGVRLRDDLAATLELESGSNDPMAVFLTTMLLGFMQPGAEVSVTRSLGSFASQMVIGAAVGWAAGFIASRTINRIGLEYRGLYPVFTIAIVVVTYGGTAAIGGNGFLAVYIAGIVMGHFNFIQRRSITRFHDGLSWLMQIAMFLVLGLLVFPKQLMPVAGVSLAIAMFLVLVARPLAVFLALLPFRIDFRSQALIGWVGLRGAVPITLATFPLLAGVPKANLIFNIIFFVVLTSVLVQGLTIPQVSRLLHVTQARHHDTTGASLPLPDRDQSELVTIVVPSSSPAAGKRLVSLKWPRESLILVIYREEEFLVPDGSTVLQAEDRAIVLADKRTSDLLHRIVGA